MPKEPIRSGRSPGRSRSSSSRRQPARGRRTFEWLEDRRVLSASTLLNEIEVNPPGRDDNRYMYVELEGTPGASLNNVWFVAIDSAACPRWPSTCRAIRSAATDSR